MADFVFNIAKGQIAWYAGLTGGANDALIVMPLETSGLETDAVLKDLDTFTAVVAGTTNEQTTMGRKTVSASITVTVDDTNDRVDIDMPDLTWTAATGNAISKLVVGYDNDTTAGTDANIVPMTCHDFVATPDGTDLVAVVAAAGFARAT